MGLNRLVVVRHAARLDTEDKTWCHTSATPYDPPLSHAGCQQATDSGGLLYNRLAKDVNMDKTSLYIHSSPFLRCIQTSAYLSAGMNKASTSPILRTDAVFGEWLTPDYFSEIVPPPPDNHATLAATSMQWARSFGSNMALDTVWKADKFGQSGEYGEDWSSMHQRFTRGLDNLVSYYNNVEDDKDKIVVIVTHGAGCNALLGYLSNQPLLSRIHLASFAIVKPEGATGWVISHQSSVDDDDGRVPILSGSSTSTSSSSMSDLYSGSPGTNVGKQFGAILTSTGVSSQPDNGQTLSDSQLSLCFSKNYNNASFSSSSGTLTPTEDKNDEFSALYRFGGNQL